jgi:hypothetical protein
MYQSTPAPYLTPFRTASTAPAVFGTPIVPKTTGSLPHSSSPVERDEFYQQLAHETRGRFVGPMPLQDFMNHYLPPRLGDAPMPSVGDNLFAGLRNAAERDTYPIVVSLDERFLCANCSGALR